MSEKPLGERIASLEAGFVNICGDIHEIRNKLLGRPSWAITIIFSFLTTLCASLLLLILK